MIYKELLFYFKKFKTTSFLSYIAITSLMLILGLSFSFIQQLKYESNNIEQIHEGKTIFHLIDGYYDGEAFQKFMEEESSLNSLKNFYSGLNQENEFSYLAMDEQPILIKERDLVSSVIQAEDEKLQGKRIQLEGENYIPLQSFQMNERSIEYFGIEVSDGSSWTSEDFMDSNGSIPLLLGSSYCDVYEIGDIFPIKLHTYNITAEVKGCIAPNEKVFYMGETEFYLDDHILLPYRTYGNPKNSEEDFFQKISYLSMINGYLVTEDNPSAIQKMMDYIAILSESSNSIQYSFVGMNPNFQRYNGLMKTLEENSELAKFNLFLTFCINVFMVVTLLALQQIRRLNYYAVHFINGAGKKELLIRILCEIGSIIVLSFITSILVLELILKLGNFYVYFSLSMIALLLIILSSLFPAYKLLKNPVANYLKYEEGDKI